MDRRFANGVHKTVEGDMQYHGKPDVSDGLPGIIVIYSQYYGTRGCCNDALGRDGVHGRTYLFWKARRGAEKSRIKLGRTYRRVPQHTLWARSRNAAKLESFSRGSRMYGLCKLGLPRSADYGTVGSKLARGSVDLITFRTTTCRTICFRINELSRVTVRCKKQITEFLNLVKHTQ